MILLISKSVWEAMDEDARKPFMKSTIRVEHDFEKFRN